MKNAKQKAIELVENYKGLVYPFIGSGMLTNTEEPSVVLSNAKECALIVVNEIIENSSFLGNKMFHKLGTDSYEARCLNKDVSDWWQEVSQEIEKL